MATISSNGSGGGASNATGSWAGGAIPVENDKVNIVSGDTITMTGTHIWGDDTSTAINVQGGGIMKASRTATSSLTCKGNLIINTLGEIDYGKSGDRISASYTHTVKLNYSASLSDGEWGMKTEYSGSTSTAKFSAWGAVKTTNTDLTSLVSATGTSFNVTSATGWAVGDLVVIGTTAPGSTGVQNEVRTVSSVSTNTIGISAGVTYAHQIGARISNFTKNILFTSHTNTSVGYVWFDEGSGGSAGDKTVSHCAFHYLGTTGGGSNHYGGFRIDGNGSNHVAWTTMEHVACYISEYACIDLYAFSSGLKEANRKTLDNFAVYNNTQMCIYFRSTSGIDATNWHLFTTSNYGIYSAWGNGMVNATWTGCWVMGGSSSSVYAAEGWGCSFTTCHFVGSYRSILISNAKDWVFTDCDFGYVSSLFDGSCSYAFYIYDYGSCDAITNNCNFNVVSGMAQRNTVKHSMQNVFWYINRKNGDWNVNEIYTSEGVIEKSSGGRTSAYSLKASPISATVPITYDWFIPAPTGVAVTVTGYLAKNPAYGSANRPSMTLSGMAITPVVVTMTDVSDTWWAFSVAATQSTGATGVLNLTLSGQSAGSSAWFKVSDITHSMPASDIDTGDMLWWHDGRPIQAIMQNNQEPVVNANVEQWNTAAVTGNTVGQEVWDHTSATTEGSIGDRISNLFSHNLCLQSEDITTTWGSSVGSPNITANATVAPNGMTTADLFTRTTTAASYINQGFTKTTAAITYSYSVYAHKSVGDYVAIRIQTVFPKRADSTFNINTGVVSSVSATTWTGESATITDVGNGWYRCTLTGTSDSGTTDLSITASFNSGGNAIDSVDTASTSAGYIWGAQLNESSVALPYRKTTTVAVTAEGVDVTQWLGTAVETPSVAGRPKVDVKAVNNSTTSAGVLGNWLGHAVNFQASGGSTTTCTSSGFSSAEVDAYIGHVINFTYLPKGPSVVITGFDPSTDTVTFTPALDTAVTSNTFGHTISGLAHANVEAWNGTAVPTPSTAGVPEVDVNRLGGSSTAAQSLGQWLGVALINGVADSGTATTLVDSALTQVDDYWNGATIQFKSGTYGGFSAVVTDFVASTDTLTFAPALPGSVTTEQYVLIPGLGHSNVEAWKGDAVQASTGGVPNVNMQEIDNNAVAADTLAAWLSEGGGYKTASSTGTTTTLIDTSLTQADDHWNGALLVIFQGTNEGSTAVVTDFVASSDTLTFTPAMPSAPDNTSVYTLIPGLGRSNVEAWAGNTAKATTNGYPDVNSYYIGGNYNTAAILKYWLSQGVSYGTVDSGTTTTIVDAALTETDDHWNGGMIVCHGGTNDGRTAIVTDFVASSNTLTFAPAMPSAMDDTTLYSIMPGLGHANVEAWKGDAVYADTAGTPNVNIKQVNNVTVDGTGAAGDEWGPS